MLEHEQETYTLNQDTIKAKEHNDITHGDNLYTCNQCEFLSTNNADLNLHVIKSHVEPNVEELYAASQIKAQHIDDIEIDNLIGEKYQGSMEKYSAYQILQKIS